MLLPGRQRNPERGASAWIVLRPHMSPVRFDNVMRNCQAQTHAIRLRGEEWLEQVFEVFRSDARTRIAQRNFGLAIEVPSANSDLTIFRRVVAGRIHRIQKKIQQYLLQLDTVATDG